MLHVGHLYRIVDLLKFIRNGDYTKEELITSFPAYRKVSTDTLLDLSLTSNWIIIARQDKIDLTEEAVGLLELDDVTLQLRNQIMVLVDAIHPAWCSAIPLGRKAFISYVDIDTAQCFRESGLLDSLDQEVIDWWDKWSATQRDRRILDLKSTGRRGERLTIDFERKRTGRSPKWIALDYEYEGYDVLSTISTDDSSELLIEVKASKQDWGYASFHLSRNEWDTLSGAKNAVVHLWSLKTNPATHSIISIASLTPHMPIERGCAKWEEVILPYSEFAVS